MKTNICLWYPRYQLQSIINLAHYDTSTSARYRLRSNVNLFLRYTKSTSMLRETRKAHLNCANLQNFSDIIHKFKI